MDLLSLLLNFLLVVAVIALIVGAYSGLFYHVVVDVRRPPVTKVTVAYKFELGAYENSGRVFQEAMKLAPKLRCFGVWYDGPCEVPVEKLRWAVGCVLSEGDEDPDPAVVKMFEEHGYKQFSFPEATNVVRTAFPFKNYLSILIAVRRVYGAIDKYIKDKKLNTGPWLEFYQGDQIDYMAVLDHHRDFYVPEAAAAGPVTG